MTAAVDVNHICELYKRVATIPAVSRGRLDQIGAAVSHVTVDWSQRDLVRSKKVTYKKNYHIKLDENGVVEKSSESPPEDTSRIEASTVTTDGTRRAVLVKEKGKTPEDHQYIEIWDNQCCQTVVAVKKFKKEHGKILRDITFSSFLFSPSGNKLLYIAEKVEPKEVPFFGTQDDDKDGPPPVKRGTEYTFKEDWGEQEIGIKSPVAVVLDLATETCTVLSTGEFSDISVGQAVWSPDELGVVFVGWNNSPRRLGIIYCSNRRSGLYYTSLEDGTCVRLTDGNGSISSPRFNPQGSKLVYLESPCGGPHHTCAQLNLINWTSKKIETVVDYVKRPTDDNKFPGIYTYTLPQHCWNENGNIVYFSSQWYSKLEMLSVNVDTRVVVHLEVKGDKHSKLILDVCGHVILVCSSSPTHPHCVVVGTLEQNGQAISTWTTIASTSCDLVDHLSWEIIPLRPTDGDQLNYEAILIKSTKETTLPALYVFPHGGPHSSFNCEFQQQVVFFANLGFAVLMVNYRGSLGFGKDSVDSLLGEVGKQEINDVHSAALHVIQLGMVDGNKVVVCGGSHGGFISIHLVGQYPDFYKAACIRNPVVDIARKLTTADNPDSYALYQESMMTH
ncbi:acylamino-acid-releasing enzyme-like isoform X1 [Dysidea avara]|uniref:acylamino-acid-releasing enzyme-like isoform X1 n=1 Tax=Dysidea avara TaxID=196820 RepID=UPI003332692A